MKTRDAFIVIRLLITLALFELSFTTTFIGLNICTTIYVHITKHKASIITAKVSKCDYENIVVPTFLDFTLVV